MNAKSRNLPQAPRTKAHSLRRTFNNIVFSLLILASMTPTHVSAGELKLASPEKGGVSPLLPENTRAVSDLPEKAPGKPDETDRTNTNSNRKIIQLGSPECEALGNPYAKAYCEAANLAPRAGVTVIIVDSLSPAQELEITRAMTTIFTMFGGAERFHEQTGISELTFVHVAQLSCPLEGAVACYTGHGVIQMTDQAFNPPNLVPGWFVAHEVGHLFDYKQAVDDPEKYRSQAFVNHFVPDDPFSNLAGQAGCKVVIGSGCTGQGWTLHVAGTGGTNYGQVNSAEDFADSFAASYAAYLSHGGQPYTTIQNCSYNSFHDCWRLSVIWDMINGKM